MASRKEELKKAKEAGESIVANKFASDATPKNAGSKTTLDDTRNDMFSMDYEAAKQKYGQKGQGNNFYFMSKDQFDRQKQKYLDEQKTTSDMKNASTGDSLIAQQFAENGGKPYQSEPTKKGKTWADVKAENGNDPAKIADYLNNTPEYKAGDLTKKGMAEMGYKQGEDGKWTIDNVLDEIDNISASDETVAKAVQSFTNPETGDVDEGKAKSAINEYEKRLVEMGAGTYDKDGNFVLKPTSKGKGWETWATLLSVGLSVIGIAMGVPIIPINFRAVTGKDSRDAQIQALQQQYMNIQAGSAETVTNMKSDIETGNLALKNGDALRAQEEHAQNMGAYKTKSDIDTSSEKELIETRTDAEIKRDEAQFKRDMQRLGADQNFQLKFAQLQQEHSKEMAQLQSALTTGSAIEVMKFQNSGFLKDLKELGMSFSDIATYTAAKNGISPSDKNWNRVNMVVDDISSIGNAVGNIIGGLNPLKKK